jgi:Raf kinase inhibitor-like YbhB/YbcL family protein
MSLILASNAFKNEGWIPEKYSKRSGNISPHLMWTGVPEETISLALIVDDPDAPSGVFTHWLLYSLPPADGELREHQPHTPELPSGARQGLNDYGQTGYSGPQPPSGMHRYFFHLYALDTNSDVTPGLNRLELDGVIHGHILEEAQLMGRYES